MSLLLNPLINTENPIFCFKTIHTHKKLHTWTYTQNTRATREKNINHKSTKTKHRIYVNRINVLDQNKIENKRMKCVQYFLWQLNTDFYVSMCIWFFTIQQKTILVGDCSSTSTFFSECGFLYRTSFFFCSCVSFSYSYSCFFRIVRSSSKES